MYVFKHAIPSVYAFEMLDELLRQHIEQYLIQKYPDISLRVALHRPGHTTDVSQWYVDVLIENEKDAMLYAIKYHTEPVIAEWLKFKDIDDDNQ